MKGQVKGSKKRRGLCPAKKVDGHFKSRRSRVLWEITALVAVVYVLGGLFAFLTASNSYNRLAQKSTDKLIAEKADSIAYTNACPAQTEMAILTSNLPQHRPRHALCGSSPSGQERLDPLQVYVNDSSRP